MNYVILLLTFLHAMHNEPTSLASSLKITPWINAETFLIPQSCLFRQNHFLLFPNLPSPSSFFVSAAAHFSSRGRLYRSLLKAHVVEFYMNSII
uniref:Secreted protein n=1 Tax=Cucumis melo TaxID=3656 RepID=A0A9I9EBR6_CUCME